MVSDGEWHEIMDLHTSTQLVYVGAYQIKYVIFQQSPNKTVTVICSIPNLSENFYLSHDFLQLLFHGI